MFKLVKGENEKLTQLLKVMFRIDLPCWRTDGRLLWNPFFSLEIALLTRWFRRQSQVGLWVQGQPGPHRNNKKSRQHLNDTESTLVCILLKYGWMWCLHVHLCTIGVQCPWMAEEGISSPGTVVRHGCELLDECWESNSCPLQEQPVLLTTKLSPVLALLKAC